MPKYSEVKQRANYNDAYAGSTTGVTLIRKSDGVRFTGGISGFTTSQSIEQIPIETIGERLPEEIVTGRYSGTLSVNGFFSLKKGDEIVPDSTTFIGLEFDAVRFITEGPNKGTILDAFTGFKISTANIQSGARGVVTFDMNGPFIERLNAENAARKFGVM